MTQSSRRLPTYINCGRHTLAYLLDACALYMISVFSYVYTHVAIHYSCNKYVNFVLTDRVFFPFIFLYLLLI